MEKVSGYAAIHESLISSPEANALIEGIARHIREACIDHYDFRTITNEGIADTETTWVINVGPNKRYFTNDQYTRFYIDVQLQVEDDAAEHIINANFGVKGRIGTRNCRKEILLNGRSSYGRSGFKPWVQSFPSYLREYVGNNKMILLFAEESRNRIIADMIRICESDEFAKRRQKFLCTEAQVEIMKTMRKYRNLPQNVLNEALSMSCVEGIMEL